MIFKRFFDFLIYSNIYIAISAVLLTIAAQIQLGIDLGLHPYLFLIFFATLAEYNFHKFIAVILYKHALHQHKFKWIADNLKLFYFIVFSSVTGFAIAAFYAKITVLITLLPLGFLTLLYSFPVYKKGIQLFRLREVPFAKIFIISFVWSATSIILPFIQAELKIGYESILLLITERFLFVFAITVPFDIRDMDSDMRAGLKTLPIVLGKGTAMHFSNIALILFMIICSVHYIISAQFFLVFAMNISALVTLIVLNSKKLNTKEHYHYGWLDGMMSLQGLLVIVFYFSME
jgi:4-hydroxybenzoate polyprenyltransferase